MCRAIEFKDLPYVLQDEFAFAQDNAEGMGEYERNATDMQVFEIDGTGYAAPAHVLLNGRPHTYRIRHGGESFVYAYSTNQWCIVGEDL